MRRKREKGATAKAKPSPEKKVEKVRRTRSRRRKQSSSENDSGDEIVQAPETITGTEQIVEETPIKENSPEDSQDQVWQVKTAEGSGDGEIKKLKICLTRPPSTPESCDRSPRSKRRHTRATSLSDTASIEGSDEKKKTRHRSKRSMCEISETIEKQCDTQTTELEQLPDISEIREVTEVQPEVIEVQPEVNEVQPEVTEVQPEVTEVQPEVTEVKPEVTEVQPEVTEVQPEVTEVQPEVTEVQPEITEVHVVADVPEMDNPVDDQGNSRNVPDPTSEKMEVDETVATEESTPSMSEAVVIDESCTDSKLSSEDVISNKDDDTKVLVEKAPSPERKRSMSFDKSEILEIHADESKIEISDLEKTETNIEQVEKLETNIEHVEKAETNIDIVEKTVENNDKMEDQESSGGTIQIEEEKVSNNEDKAEKNVVESSESPQNEIMSTNETAVVAITENPSKEIGNDTVADEKPTEKSLEKPMDHSESAQSSNEETVHNGHTNIVINRKRRWGSRPSRLASQKSITISTDVLKEIIPDVKPVEFEEVIEDKKQHKRVEVSEKVERPVLPKIVIDNTANIELKREKEQEVTDSVKHKDATTLASNRKISIVKETESATIRPPSPPRGEQSNILFITNLVRPFTLSQLRNLLQRTGRIMENGFWIDKIKSKCYVIYENEDQAVETRHALHGVTWPVSNPKKLHVDFSTQEEFDKAKANEETDEAQTSTIPGTVEDWLREQDMKRERGEMEKPWERKSTREWDIGKNEKGKEKEKEKLRRDDKSLEKRRHHTPERSPEPAKKFKKKEEAPAKLLDDLFRKTKTTPCIYWLPLSAETIAIKEEQRRQHMAEHEKRMQELRRTHRRH